MKQMRRKRQGEGNKPPMYYRSGLTADDFRRVMGDGVWTINQIAASIAEFMPPETKARYAEMHAKGDCSANLSVRMVRGARDFCRMRMNGYYFKKMVEKHGRGKDATYRWKTKINQAGQDSA